MSKNRRQSGGILLTQIGLVVAFLLVWEFLPNVEAITKVVPWNNRFFISSPSAIAGKIWALFTGSAGTLVWPYLVRTVIAALSGCVLGLTLGALFGLLCSHFKVLSRIFAPFIAAGNSVPRVALIPIVILIVGPTIRTSVVSAILVVFFLGFFNAFKGGQSVPVAVLENARVIGATSAQIMRSVRLPYVLIWTFAVLPNAISFGITSVVTSEILTGLKGMGNLILVATAGLDAATIFAVVTILGVVGGLVYKIAERIERRVLFWRHVEVTRG